MSWNDFQRSACNRYHDCFLLLGEPVAMAKQGGRLPHINLTRGRTSNLAVMTRLTWGDSDTVAIDDGPLLLLLLGGLDAGFFHVADRLVTLPLAL